MSVLARWWGVCCGSRMKPPRGGGDSDTEAAPRPEAQDLSEVRPSGSCRWNLQARMLVSTRVRHTTGLYGSPGSKVLWWMETDARNPTEAVTTHRYGWTPAGLPRDPESCLSIQEHPNIPFSEIERALRVSASSTP